MQDDYRIASTYFDLSLRHHPELVTMISQGLDLSAETLLSASYIDGQLANTFFEYVAQKGIQSWILEYAESTAITSHGPLGFAILSAPDLQTALQVLTEFQSIRLSSHTSRLEQHGKQASVIIENNIQHSLASRWLLETNFNVLKNLIENIVSHPVGDRGRIDFMCSAPDYASDLETFYQIECHYKQAQNAFRFPASWCEISSPISNEVSFRTSVAQCEELKFAFEQNNHADTIRAKLKRIFYERIDTRHPSKEIPNLEEFAVLFSMSSRTLNRALKKQNTSYKECLASVRHDTAIDLLANTHMTIATIADKLAYQEPANFIRAFKKWSGKTPAAWRKLS